MQVLRDTKYFVKSYYTPPSLTHPHLHHDADAMDVDDAHDKEMIRVLVQIINLPQPQLPLPDSEPEPHPHLHLDPSARDFFTRRRQEAADHRPLVGPPPFENLLIPRRSSVQHLLREAERAFSTLYRMCKGEGAREVGNGVGAVGADPLPQQADVALAPSAPLGNLAVPMDVGEPQPQPQPQAAKEGETVAATSIPPPSTTPFRITRIISPLQDPFTGFIDGQLIQVEVEGSVLLEPRWRYAGGSEDWMVWCRGCGVTDDDGERMVECDLCKVWEHTRCGGIPDDEEPGPTYVCKACAAATATAVVEAAAAEAAVVEGEVGAEARQPAFDQRELIEVAAVAPAEEEARRLQPHSDQLHEAAVNSCSSVAKDLVMPVATAEDLVVTSIATAEDLVMANVATAEDLVMAMEGGEARVEPQMEVEPGPEPVVEPPAGDHGHACEAEDHMAVD